MKKIILFFTVFFFNANLFASEINPSDNWIGEPYSGFKKSSSVKGKKYMISSADELASKAGEWALKKGGNAIDAAIAAQLVLNVVEPHSSGIGGGAFLLYYDAKTKSTIYFNGRETAPAKSYSTMFLNKDHEARDFFDVVRGGLSVGTPGLLKLLKTTHEKYGKLPWSTLFKPAIDVASNGFIVNQRMHELSKNVTYLKDFPETAATYLKADGAPYLVGETITNKKLANTLQIIAKDGIEPFYSGQIAKDIVTAVKNSPINPGYLSLSDLKNYKIKSGDLICATYRIKFKVCSMPLPSSGGITLLQILGILENFDLSELKPNSKEAVHLIMEATRLSYADRNEYIADVSSVPIKQMLDKTYLKNRANLIDKNKAMKEVKAGKFFDSKAISNKFIKISSQEMPSTTHLSIVDSQGNAVALTSSIEYFFGSALSVDGFMLNNQLTDFSLTPAINGKLVANRLQPGKQPRSSMSPTFVFDENDKLIMVLGSPGGPRIIQFTLKTIINHLDFKMDIQKAISSPNFVVLNGVIELENNTDITKLKPELEEMGHQVKLIEVTSGINAVTIDEDGEIRGGADTRRGGAARGE